jgi:hypothetical protein
MKIIFTPYIATETELLHPEPAIKNLPEWYKRKSPHMEGNKDKYYANGKKNITVKRCNPFGDALGAGYVIRLENDIHVTGGEDLPELVWNRGGEEFVGIHSIQQVSPELIPDGFYNQPFKFTNFWSIKTPRGYSSLFTHPLNRTDLPFITLDGIVETDTYSSAVHFPFLLRKDFEGFIEAGTPVAQVIPFKREAWSMSVGNRDSKALEKAESEFARTMHRYYKRFHWVRKSWQ